MPLKRCTENGKSGWKWGGGKCYTGPGAKKKAIKQGVAIEGPEKFASKAYEINLTIDELEEAIKSYSAVDKIIARMKYSCESKGT